jgi:hypothetical protein
MAAGRGERGRRPRTDDTVKTIDAREKACARGEATGWPGRPEAEAVNRAMAGGWCEGRIAGRMRGQMRGRSGVYSVRLQLARGQSDRWGTRMVESGGSRARRGATTAPAGDLTLQLKYFG